MANDDVAAVAIEAYAEAQMTRVMMDGLLQLMVRGGLRREELEDVMGAALQSFLEGAEPGGIQERAAQQFRTRLKNQLARLFPN